MKTLLYPILLFCMSSSLVAQDYTWVKGPNTSGSLGTYGTMGVPASSNNPGGRHGCGKWIDASGNLWLFGGEGYSNSSTLCWMNDLWKYDVNTNEWTWIRGSNGPNSTGNYGTIGVAAPTNEPPAREFMSCWTDNSGNFWMYGGDGVVSTVTPAIANKLNDLWKYDPTTNVWTWVKGTNLGDQVGVYGTQGVAAPSNLPPGRLRSAVWTDAAGDFWFFGGIGYASANIQGFTNDLWKYTISSNNWTWVSGSNLTGQFGNYGTLGVPSVTNAPGGRDDPNGFVGANGELYLFGGRGFAASTVDYMNDLWKFNPVNSTWTWVNGTSNVNDPGIYGTLGIPSASTMPGGRRSAASWKDASGNFWVFGGKGSATPTNIGELSDLFRYNPTTNEWTWMKGPAVEAQNGNYGTLGVTAASNNPGAREFNNYWTGQNNLLWLFGGEGLDFNNTSVDHMSDLWKYKIPCNPDSITVSPGKSICSGQSFTLNSVNGGPSTNWFTSPTSSTSIASGVTYTSGVLSTTSTPLVLDYYAEANNCSSQPRPAISITVNALPTLSVSSVNTLLCSGYPTTLSVTGANTYTWNTNPSQFSSSIIINPNTTTTFVAIGMDLNGCTSNISYVQKVVVCPGIFENQNIENSHALFPNPSEGNFVIELSNFNSKSLIIVFNALGSEVYRKQLTNEKTILNTNLSEGIYFYKIEQENKVTGSGKLIIH